MSLRLLVSVRDVAEATAAAQAGVDFIDLKDPAAGALGGLPPERISEVVRALRAGRGPGGTFSGRISATIGDWPIDALPAILQRVAAVAATGVDYVKVGIASGTHTSQVTNEAQAVRLLHALAGCDATIVPVLIADHGIPRAALDAALALPPASAKAPPAARCAFPAVMLDTEDKRGGCLLQRVPGPALQAFVDQVRAAGVLSGLAGALRLADLPSLEAIGPDFAGFRSAVCAGDRAQALDPARLRALREAAAGLHAPGHSAAVVPTQATLTSNV